jgi:4-hydroxy-L-threonine phosphate dehydrogenase PdxA
MSRKVKIAIAVGDPAGIGPEIALKAALNHKVRAACDPILVGDSTIIERHAAACGINVKLRAVARVADSDWTADKINVLNCARDDAQTIELGKIAPAAGRASIAFCAAAIQAALAGDVDAVAAAPQHETSVAQAGIRYDGHPSFVARQTGTPEDDVYMMLCCGDLKIAHATLHRSVRQAIGEITRERIDRVFAATHLALQRLGIERPAIAVSGLNPHAGENGLFGDEEIEIIAPAIHDAALRELDVSQPRRDDRCGAAAVECETPQPALILVGTTKRSSHGAAEARGSASDFRLATEWPITRHDEIRRFEP